MAEDRDSSFRQALHTSKPIILTLQTDADPACEKTEGIHTHHDLLIAVWRQQQRDNDLVFQQWRLFIFKHFIECVQLPREQRKIVQHGRPGKREQDKDIVEGLEVEAGRCFL